MIQLEYDILEEIMSSGEKTYIDKAKFEGEVSYFKELSNATNMTLFLGVSKNDECSIFTYGGYRIANFNKKTFGNSLDLDKFYGLVAKTLAKEPEYLKNMPIALFTESFKNKFKECYYFEIIKNLQTFNMPKKMLNKKVKERMKPVITELNKNNPKKHSSLKTKSKDKNL